MKRLFIFSFFFYSLSIIAFAQRPPCVAHEHLEESIQNDQEFAKERILIEEKTQQFTTSGRVVNGTITIPVVFHIIHNGDAVGSGENIAESYILAQLQQLNDDFRRLNSDKGNTPSDFSGVASDSEIEFCLANVDPNGFMTNGITRTPTTTTSFGINDDIKSTTSGGINPWNTAHYLNMWVGNLGGGLLGYSQFPGGNPATDGVVIDYRYFGNTGTATAPFDLGRTATHEVGHYLNLAHIWGDGGCSVCEAAS